MRTRFCETIFWGKDSQNRDYCFLNSAGILDFARAEEGSGEESARAFFWIFWRGGQKIHKKPFLSKWL
jgi:hypothetical protein